MITRQSISIVIADDHPVVLRGLAGILRMQADFHIVEACSDGAAALDAIERHDPDVAVLDLSMPRQTGLDVLMRLVEAQKRTKVIFLTATATDLETLAGIAQGAKGVMLKDAAPDQLIECIREVAAGRLWLPHDVVNAALERETGRRLRGTRMTDGLTERERDVMRLVAKGQSNKEVGRRLGLSEGTIKIHLHNIYKKLGVPNRTTLAAVAITYQDQRVD
jgi:DNA-binding NarL/FixJ family response regulator